MQRKQSASKNHDQEDQLTEYTYLIAQYPISFGRTTDEGGLLIMGSDIFVPTLCRCLAKAPVLRCSKGSSSPCRATGFIREHWFRDFLLVEHHIQCQRIVIYTRLGRWYSPAAYYIMDKVHSIGSLCKYPPELKVSPCLRKISS